MDFNDSGCFKTLKSDECKYQKYVESKQIAANYRIILGFEFFDEKLLNL